MAKSNGSEKRTSLGAHFFVLLVNALFIHKLIEYVQQGSVSIRHTVLIDGGSAQLMLALFFLCILVLDFIYLKSIFNRNNENI